MEGIDDKEMNEFVKKNPEYAEDFYRQMRDRYKHTGTTEPQIEMRAETWFFLPDPYEYVWPKDPLKFP